MVHIQNGLITIEWSPQVKDESFDAEFQRSLRLLTDGKLEVGKIHPGGSDVPIAR